MMRTSGSWLTFVVLVAGSFTSGCGRDAPPQPATPAADVAAGEAPSGLEPCELLNAEQVASVLPDATPMTTHSGGSLIEGVDAYQCSYSDAAGGLLTVILNVAVDEARFDQIKPGGGVRESREPVDVADAGWLGVTPDEVKVKAVRGFTVIDVELMAGGAGEKSSQVVDLARAVASRIP
jgi:hypothetical protein